MARRDSPSSPNSPHNRLPQGNRLAESEVVDFDIQRELDHLEEIIYESLSIPFVRLTLVDEEKLISQLDLVRLNLPEAFERALAVIAQKQEILQQAEAYAQRIIQSAQQRAAEILDETGIIQHAEREASQIRHQVQQECQTLQQQTVTEIEQSRRAVTQELQQLRQQTLAECREIQEGADSYADSILANLERQLSEMLKVVHNGRQQIHSNSSPASPPPRKMPGNPRQRK
jgi:cell division septum initiation protein DivIVA